MSEERHITQIEKSFADFDSDADANQVGITTDNDDYIFTNWDASWTYATARQYSYDGSTFTYLDNEFKNVTLDGTLFVEEYVRRRSGVEENIRFESNKMTFSVADNDEFVLERDKIYTTQVLLYASIGKATFESWHNNTNIFAFQIGGLGSIYSARNTASGNFTEIMNNLFANTASPPFSGYERIIGDEGSKYLQYGGEHIFYTVANGGTGVEVDLVRQFKVALDGGLFWDNPKIGATQTDSGASTNELWVDSSDINKVKLGT